MSHWHIEGTKPRQRVEESLQVTLVDYLKLFALPDVIWFAIPNGEKRSKATGGRLKAQGVLAGVADMCFVLPDATVAFLELKTPEGRQSPAQRLFEKRCLAIGVPYLVSSDFDTITRVLAAWGVTRRQPLRASFREGLTTSSD